MSKNLAYETLISQTWAIQVKDNRRSATKEWRLENSHVASNDELVKLAQL